MESFRCRLAFGLLFLAGPAAAEPWRATYVFTAAGVTIMEAVVDVDFGGPAGPYLIETRTRARGLATLFLRGEQVSRSEGVWRGRNPLPRLHRSSGNWRGSPRRTVLSYSPEGVPRVVTLEPAQDIERSPIPPDSLPGAIDTLSAMMRLSRQIQETGRCEGQARVFDGRRLTQLALTTEAERQPAGGGQPSCAIESRIIGGLPLERPEDARPMRSVVHFGNPVQPGAPILPLRVELASRWWGTIQVTLHQLGRG